MPYSHIENNHRITFADEGDYLRAKLIYLEHFQDDASTSYSFAFFIERRLYQGREPIRRGRIHVENIESIETVPFTVPLYHSADNTVYATDAQRRAADDFNRQRAMDMQMRHAYNEASVHAMTREENQRRMEQDFRTLMELRDHPIQNAPSIDLLQRLQAEGIDFLTPAVPIPRQISEEEFRREYNAEPIGVEEESEKEDVVKKKPNKKKTIFDIIDID